MKKFGIAALLLFYGVVSLAHGQAAPPVSMAPARAQTPEQQVKDATDCQAFAKQESGWDTAKGAAVGGLLGALGGAAAGAAIGAASGHAGKGAAIGGAAGGVTGAVGGGVYKYAKSKEGYERAYTDCMTPRGYVPASAAGVAPPVTPAPVAAVQAVPQPFAVPQQMGVPQQMATPQQMGVPQQLAAVPPLQDMRRVNLLGPENGGQLLAAPSDLWGRTIDGREDAVGWFMSGEEAIFGFKGEQPATFDTFSILIPDGGENVKELELFIGDSLNGPFRLVGRFQPQNLRLFRTGGYQDFTFPPVTARYVKVKLVSGYGASGDPSRTRMKLHELRLIGQLGGPGS